VPPQTFSSGAGAGPRIADTAINYNNQQKLILASFRVRLDRLETVEQEVGDVPGQ